ncbi:hypothetical protein SMSKK35_0883 [Stenotrophomonas maltophilia SKK35]|nr:hypothetical protein SMSKK35_0883 [Stenotrophomonas maltophilia SKK35]
MLSRCSPRAHGSRACTRVAPAQACAPAFPHYQKDFPMSDHVPVSRPNPVLELLFGGNMLEGTFKAVVWVALLAAVLAWTTFR